MATVGVSFWAGERATRCCGEAFSRVSKSLPGTTGSATPPSPHRSQPSAHLSNGWKAGPPNPTPELHASRHRGLSHEEVRRDHRGRGRVETDSVRPDLQGEFRMLGYGRSAGHDRNAPIEGRVAYDRDGPRRELRSRSDAQGKADNSDPLRCDRSRIGLRRQMLFQCNVPPSRLENLGDHANAEDVGLAGKGDQQGPAFDIRGR